MKKIIILLICTLFFSCEEDKEIEVDVEPQLEVNIVDLTENSVSGASVYVYPSLLDFKNESNLIKSGITNNNGMVLFENMKENINYYLRAKLDDRDNLITETHMESFLYKNQKIKVTIILK